MPLSHIILICPCKHHNKKRERSDCRQGNADHKKGNLAESKHNGKANPEQHKHYNKILPRLPMPHTLRLSYLHSHSDDRCILLSMIRIKNQRMHLCHSHLLIAFTLAAAELQQAIDADHLHKRDELELLTPEAMRPLARLGILMLVAAGIFFVALNLATYSWQMHTFHLHCHSGRCSPLARHQYHWLTLSSCHYTNLFTAWHFSSGAENRSSAQSYRSHFTVVHVNRSSSRNQYLVVGLAPLVIITLAALVLTLFFPLLASYTLFANLSNFSGAVGDVWVATRISQQPAHILVEDTDAGYRAWEITAE